MNTYEKIVEIIEKNQAQEIEHNALFNTVRAAFVPFEGKAISKRMGTAAQKALDAKYPGKYSANYCLEYGNYKVSISPNTHKVGDKFYPDYNARLTLYMGGAWDGVFTLAGRPTDGCKVRDGFDSASGFAGYAAVSRIASRAALLKDTKRIQEIADALDAYNKARAALLGDTTGLLKRWDDGAEDRNVVDAYAIEKLMDGSK